jgi:hypothetical protein
MPRIALPALMLLGFLGVGGCGADGEPVQPTASVGVGVSTSGVHGGGSVGVRKGPWTVTWGQYL